MVFDGLEAYEGQFARGAYHLNVFNAIGAGVMATMGESHPPPGVAKSKRGWHSFETSLSPPFPAQNNDMQR